MKDEEMEEGEAGTGNVIKEEMKMNKTHHRFPTNNVNVIPYKQILQ